MQLLLDQQGSCGSATDNGLDGGLEQNRRLCQSWSSTEKLALVPMAAVLPPSAFAPFFLAFFGILAQPSPTLRTCAVDHHEYQK